MWGPKGWTFEVAKLDFRPGGVLHYSQKPTDGNRLWVKFIYSKIIALEKMDYTFFSNYTFFSRFLFNTQRNKKSNLILCVHFISL